MVKLLCMAVFALAIAAAAAFAETPVTNAMPDPAASPAPSDPATGPGAMQPGQVLGEFRAPAEQRAPEAARGAAAVRRDAQGRGGIAVDRGDPRWLVNADRRERLRERLARMTPEQRAALIERMRERRAQRQAGMAR